MFPVTGNKYLGFLSPLSDHTIADPRAQQSYFLVSRIQDGFCRTPEDSSVLHIAKTRNALCSHRLGSDE
jgi:hypothetical protein